MFQSLRWRLMIFFSGIVIVTLLLGGGAASWVTRRQFESLALAEGRDSAKELAPYLEAAYNYSDSWEHLDKLVVGEDRVVQQGVIEVSSSAEPMVKEGGYQEPFMTETMPAEENVAPASPQYLDPLEPIAVKVGLTTDQFYTALENQSFEALIAEKGISRSDVIREYMQVERQNNESYYGGSSAEQILNLASSRSVIDYWLDQSNLTDEEYNPQKTDLYNVWNGLVGEERIFVVDSAEMIIWDSHQNERTGEEMPAEWAEQSIPLFNWNSGEQIGSVVVASGQAFYDQQQQAFIQQVNFSFLGIGSAALLLGLLISFMLSQRITQPVIALTQASRELAEGRRLTPLPVTSKDELGQMSSSFNQMAASLELQRELRSRLIHDVSHELNTPLTVIQLEAEALGDEIQSAEETLPRIHHELAHLRQLVQDLTQVADNNDVSLQFHLEPTPIDPILRSAVARWKATATQHQLSVQLGELQGEGVELPIDEQRIEQLLNNLISNGIRYTEAGGSITVGGRRGQLPNESGEWYIVTVKDTGIGIPSAELPHIFERFYRVDRSRNRAKGGRGLGLAIAQQVVNGHHGRIWVESELGKGSCFYVALPL